MNDIPDFSKVPFVESPKEDSIPDFSTVPFVSEEKTASPQTVREKKGKPLEKFLKSKDGLEPLQGVTEFAIGGVLNIPEAATSVIERIGGGIYSSLQGEGYASGSERAKKERPLSKYVPGYTFKTKTAQKLGEEFTKGVETLVDAASATATIAMGKRVSPKVFQKSDNLKAVIADAVDAGMIIAAGKGGLSLRSKAPAKEVPSKETHVSQVESPAPSVKTEGTYPVVTIKAEPELPHGKILEIAPFDPKGKLSFEEYSSQVKKALEITERAFLREQGIELKSNPLHGDYVNAMKQLNLSRAYADLEAQRAKEPGVKPALDDKLWKNKEHEILDEHIDNLIKKGDLPMGAQGGAIDPRVFAESLAKAGKSAKEIAEKLKEKFGAPISDIAAAVADQAISKQKDVAEGIQKLSSNLPVEGRRTSALGGIEPIDDALPKEITAKNVTNSFYALANKAIEDKLSILDTLKKIPKEEREILSSEDFYHALEKDQANLTPTQRALRDKYITPLREELVRIYNKLKDANLDPDVDTSTYVPRIVPAHNRLFDPDVPIGAGTYQGATSLGAKPGALKSRKMMALVDEQGNRKIVEVDGKNIFTFDETGKPVLIAEGDRVFKKGDEINGYRLEDATTKEIEANTPIRYHKDALANFLYTVERMRRAERELDFLNALKSSPEWKSIAVPFGKGTPPLGWAEAQNPALRGWYIEPRIREVLDDFAGKGPSDVVALLEGINRIIVGSLFINPIPHLLNITDHWFTQRGLTGWVTPQGLKRLIDTSPIAMREVLTQGPLYREFLTNGAGLQWARVLTQDFYQKLLPHLSKDPGFVELAKSLGKSPVELVRSIYRGSSHIMWALSDVMQLQAYLEKKVKLQSQGRYESIGQVIEETEKHMPPYKVPSRIAEKELSRILGNKAGSLASRGASIVMRAPLINTFGRYKYGRAASLLHMAKDFVKGDMKTKAETIDKIAALALAIYVVYPLLSKISSALTGKEIEAEKFGGSKVVQTFYDFANGDKDYERVLGLFWQMPPLTKAGVELASNRELFTGKPVIYPGQDIEGVGIDLMEYIMKNVPVFQMGAAPTYFAKDPEEFLLQQMGMRTVETEKRKKEIAKRMKQRQLRQHLMQRRKRENKRKSQ